MRPLLLIRLLLLACCPLALFGNSTNPLSPGNPVVSYAVTSFSVPSSSACTYYQDSDGDGYGLDNSTITMVCSTPPVGYASVGGDCNDSNNAVNPGAAEVCNGIDDNCNCQTDEDLPVNYYYADADNDGYGNPAVEAATCGAAPSGFVLDNTDCNDGNAAINPASTEICDEIDNNCNGLTDEGVQNTYYADIDDDGYGDPGSSVLACSAPEGYVVDNTDCNDENAAVNPAATEICNDGVDDDCDGLSDDEDPSVTGQDTWYADADGDGYGNAEVSQLSCTQPEGYVSDNTDCDDDNDDVNPGATEICNEIDDDCDGDIDEGVQTIFYQDNDGDGYGDPEFTVTDCESPGSGYVTIGGDCNDANADINPGEIEACNEIDDNCDGIVDNIPAGPMGWQVQSDFFGTRDGVSQPRSMRGIALSGDANSFYLGLIQGTSSSAIRKVKSDIHTNSGSDAIILGNFSGFPGGLYDMHSSNPAYDGGATGVFEDAIQLNGPQMRALATDDRNNVYAVNGTSGSNPWIRIYDSGLNQVGTFTFTSPSAQGRGLDVKKEGSTYYVYVALSSGLVERWDVTNVASPTIDATWGTAGRIDIKTVPGWSAAYANGIDVDDDGTLYIAGGLTGSHGSAVFKIAPGGVLTGATKVDLTNSMDVAVYGDNIYVASYNGNNSKVYVVDKNAMASPDSIMTGIARNNNDGDNGYSGIEIGADGRIYVVDQIYDFVNSGYVPPVTSFNATPAAMATRVYFDRVLVSNPLIAPITIVGETTPTPCSNIAEGSVNITVCGGEAPYSYLWSNGATTQDLTGVVSGFYTVTVTDNNSSTAVSSFNVTATETAITYYADADGDGYGDPESSITTCVEPDGYVLNSDDCDDNNDDVNPGAAEICNEIDDNCDGNIDEGVQTTFYADADDDGYGDAGSSVLACSAPEGYVADNTDCDDDNSAVNPGATEICNGIDDDCDGLTDNDDPSVTGQTTYYADADGDGYGDAEVSVLSCSTPEGYVTDDTDCDDSNEDVHPGATEICNEIDDDCDGSIDEEVQSTFYADTDEDGYGDAENSVLACSAPEGYVADNTDCDDDNSSVNPGAIEECNGIDDDCDGDIDEGVLLTFYADTDDDGYGDPENSIQDCLAPEGYVSDNTDCDDGNNLVNPGQTEICGDDIDNNCDGFVDEDCPVTYCPSSGSGALGNKFIKQVRLVKVGNPAFLINNISNNNGGYGDYTSINTLVDVGAQYKFTLFPSIIVGGPTVTFAWKIWIDYNRDGDFDDAGENVSTVSATGNVSPPNVTIPGSAVQEQDLRMRISMKLGTIPITYTGPCDTGFNGEVEDYTITVNGAISRLKSKSNTINGQEAPNFVELPMQKDLDFEIFPNPTQGHVWLNCTGNYEGEATAYVFDLQGKKIHQQKVTMSNNQKLQLDMPGLASGTYSVTVVNDQDQIQSQLLEVRN